jgi:hypothetical protein
MRKTSASCFEAVRCGNFAFARRLTGGAA